MQEEIDLIELFVKFITFIKTKIKIILLAIVVGCVFGIVVYYIQPEKFLYSITGYSPFIKTNVVSNSISEFATELKNDKIEFCKSNDLDKEIFNKIKSIEIKNIKTNKEEDLEIILTTASLINIDDISLELENYISKNSFISEKLAIHNTQLKNTILFLNKQIEKIDNRKTLSLTESENGNIENSAALLYKDKNKCEEELAFLKPFIITNISIPQNEKHGLLACSVGGSSIAIFLIFLIYFLQKINSMTKIVNVKKPSIKYLKESA